MKQLPNTQPGLDQILLQAEADFEKAQEELLRPSTDVVAFSACFFARRALHHYLYYLYQIYHGNSAVKPAGELTIEEMADHCSQFDERIANIDFEWMNCRDVDVINEDYLFYCNDVGKLNSCKSLAEQMRNIVMAS